RGASAGHGRRTRCLRDDRGGIRGARPRGPTAGSRRLPQLARPAGSGANRTGARSPGRVAGRRARDEARARPCRRRRARIRRGGPAVTDTAASAHGRHALVVPDMVTAEHLSRSYRSAAGEVHALQDVSFNIPAGALAALVGRSGSGKTTLLNCIGGLDEPTSGTVVVDGIEVSALDEKARTLLRRDQIAFVFQTVGLIPMLSASENVGLPLRLRKTEPKQRAERVAAMLDLVGLSAHAAQRPS